MIPHLDVEDAYYLLRLGDKLVNTDFFDDNDFGGYGSGRSRVYKPQCITNSGISPKGVGFLYHESRLAAYSLGLIVAPPDTALLYTLVVPQTRILDLAFHPEDQTSTNTYISSLDDFHQYLRMMGI